MKKVVLNISDLTFGYNKEKLIYKNFNFVLNQGEIKSIVGSSGSGKSTMMNMVGALDVPSKGAIYLDGHDISKLFESDLAEIRGKKIGFGRSYNKKGIKQQKQYYRRRKPARGSY